MTAPKLLILEDEKNLAQLLKELFGFEGYDVLVPKSFEDVIKSALEFAPDGLVMDIHLDDVDGLELIRDLRQQKFEKEPYILALSGIDHSYAAKEAGANDFVQKPFMPDEIIDLLNKNMKS